MVEKKIAAGRDFKIFEWTNTEVTEKGRIITTRYYVYVDGEERKGRKLTDSVYMDEKGEFYVIERGYTIETFDDDYGADFSYIPDLVERVKTCKIENADRVVRVIESELSKIKDAEIARKLENIAKELKRAWETWWEEENKKKWEELKKRRDEEIRKREEEKRKEEEERKRKEQDPIYQIKLKFYEFAEGYADEKTKAFFRERKNKPVTIPESEIVTIFASSYDYCAKLFFDQKGNLLSWHYTYHI